MVLVKSLRFGLLLALCNIYQENVFGDVLVRKQGFQTIETKIYENRKIGIIVTPCIPRIG